MDIARTLTGRKPLENDGPWKAVRKRRWKPHHPQARRAEGQSDAPGNRACDPGSHNVSTERSIPRSNDRREIVGLPMRPSTNRPSTPLRGGDLVTTFASVPPFNSSEPSTVLLFGGKGGLLHRYRKAVEEHGYKLRYFEKRMPTGRKRTLGNVAMVVVMVNMMSHALLDQARELAHDGASIVYLKSSSASALRDAVARKTT